MRLLTQKKSCPAANSTVTTANLTITGETSRPGSTYNESLHPETHLSRGSLHFMEEAMRKLLIVVVLAVAVAVFVYIAMETADNALLPIPMPMSG
jgi:hypothetical protein